MRRIYLTIVFLVAGLCTAYAQLDREALERDRMRQNSVRECTQFTHKYNKGKPNPEGYKTSTTTYDRNGNPTLIINYRSNGQESSRLHYTYDREGKRLEYKKEETLGGKKMKVSFRQTFTYDRNGRKKTELGFDGSSTYRIVYSYLPNGNLSDITRYKADNSVSERWIYSYRDNKQVLRVIPKNGPMRIVEKTFDRENRLIVDCQLDTAGKEQRKVEYTYDRAGRIETESLSYAGNLRYRLHYIFNDRGQLVRVLQKRPEGEEFVNNDYTYDDDGNLVTEEWVDGDPSLVSKKDSEFDQKGDMVRVDSYYAPYKYRVMYSYKYKKY